ncbi:hypothetical protein SAPIO_CDS5298 [Scedosporium apiospermum]|uniref:HNH nuclease domain-containing protein n=1 Tax=Pseudallescheria apiosperma TaxID=563466 RepID=A0A084G6A8_PSEDA|nr:uncharacterized protein SAPIO_CDS5298 [Scedosporium apiospermum]KEZ42870.1 hypothetical protein SAPIO_CDS5298 [Scedosporium apiospermum]
MSSNQEDTNRQLVQQCAAFLQRPELDPQTRDALRAFVTSPLATCVPPSVNYVDNIEERARIGHAIQECDRNPPTGRANPILWSLIMVAPLDRLREMLDETCTNQSSVLSSKAIFYGLGNILTSLLKIFLAKDQVRPDPLPYQERGLPPTAVCRWRDSHRCVLTGAANPTVCHIFPYGSEQRRKSVDQIFGLLINFLWGSERCARLQALLTANDRVLDSPQNMICLEPLLHRWWRMAYIALEPYEKLPDGVRVRLRWLHRTPFDVEQRLDLDTDPRQHLSSPSVAGLLKMVDFRSGHPLLDGTIVDLVSSDPNQCVSFEILELQWDLLRLAALSGAAEAAQGASWDPDDDLSFGIQEGRQVASSQRIFVD